MMMLPRDTAELLLQIGRFIQVASRDGVLNPAQWMALRYFSRANLLSRTPTAFANFQATSCGTASVVIKELKTDGYLTQDRPGTDGRSVRLRLTAKGKKALASDPFGVLVRAVDSLDLKDRATLHGTLDHLLTSIAAGERHQRVGICRDCVHFREEKSSSPASASLKCQLHGTSIDPHEADFLCSHFHPTTLD